MLVIRRVEAGDVDGLEELYDRLDDDARYRRFFSGYRPKRPFFERMVTIRDRGGAGLVAAVGAAGGPEQLVAEAGYELLPNGDGELAITVDRSWRGWLGPYLLGSLCDVAASRGVPNLEADVLVTNRPMLALLRARGYAAMPTRDWSSLRGLIGTSTKAPTWPGASGDRRVLVEGAGGHWHATDDAEAAGLQVVCCPGPVGRQPGCPALAGEPCPLAAGADAIVISHPPDDDDWRALRAAHRDLHPGVPVYVERSRNGHATADDDRDVPPCSDLELLALLGGVGPT